MRKKSHILLAKHIVSVSGMPGLDRHQKAFYVGSILPDCQPSFLTRRHEITATFDLVRHGIEKLTTGYHDMEELSTAYFTKLGEVLHYIADYFTFPHNKQYPGNIKQHCVYEGELKHKLRAYVRNLKERVASEELEQFQSGADICSFLKREHRSYIRSRNHSVEEDCRHIVEVCTKVALAIMHVCMMSMERRNVCVVVH